MSEKPILIATVGLPRSGKSTWSDGVMSPAITRNAAFIRRRSSCVIPSPKAGQ